MSTSATFGSTPKKPQPSSKGQTEAVSAEDGARLPPQLLVITTGGTIDKSYDVVNENFSFVGESAVPGLVRGAYISNIQIQEVLKLDSWEMEKEHRMKIIAAIEKSPIQRIVVVHGTSTMIETGVLLAETFGTDKTIVLTGALKPF